MTPCHLTDYHLSGIDFGAVWCLKNGLVSRNPTTLRRIAKRGTKLKPIHNSKTITLFKNMELSYTILFTAAGISMFHMCICRLQCVIARSGPCCASAAPYQTITRPPM